MKQQSCLFVVVDAKCLSIPPAGPSCYDSSCETTMLSKSVRRDFKCQGWRGKHTWIESEFRAGGVCAVIIHDPHAEMSSGMWIDGMGWALRVGIYSGYHLAGTRYAGGVLELLFSKNI